jgi:hypothetical protein
LIRIQTLVATLPHIHRGLLSDPQAFNPPYQIKLFFFSLKGTTPIFILHVIILHASSFIALVTYRMFFLPIILQFPLLSSPPTSTIPKERELIRSYFPIYSILKTSVADPDHFYLDPEPSFHFDASSNPDPDPTVLYDVLEKLFTDVGASVVFLYCLR